MSDAETDVLIVGAGPTGLMVANWLARFGVSSLVLDHKDGPTVQSRAVALQARSLEIYDQLGMAGEVQRESEAVRAIAPGYRRRRFGVLPIGELGAGTTPYPRLYVLEQSRNETLLSENLRRSGGAVSWGHRLVSLADDADGVSAVIDGPEGRMTVHARYCVGADGSGSAVRTSRGIAFEGLTNPQSFFVCDAADATGLSRDAINIRLGDEDFLITFPMRGRGRQRLIGSTAVAAAAGGDDESALRRHLARAYGLSWGESAWFATYRVHHRIAASFRDGPVFLAGDAAHVHSPVGGQGMNTGLQDAHDLALKLVDVLVHGAPDATLDRYEAERRPVATRLVATTDRAFRAVISPTRLARMLRGRVAPIVLPVLLGLLPRLGIVPRLFGYLSQTRIHYWMSDEEKAASGGRRDRVVGRRLRFAGGNFDVLRSARWQVHSYGGMDPSAVRALRDELGIEVHTFPSNSRSGLAPGTFYLVRPDGFVAARAAPDAAVTEFRRRVPPGTIATSPLGSTSIRASGRP